MGIIGEKWTKSKRTKENRENENSLIWAMYDSGYKVSEIANQLDLPLRTVYLRLGLGPNS